MSDDPRKTASQWNSDVESLRQQHATTAPFLPPSQTGGHQYHELVDLLLQGVLEVDAAGRLISASRTALRMFGYLEEDSARGLSVVDMLIPADRQTAELNIRKYVSGETIQPSRYTALRKDGSTFPMMLYSSLLIIDGKACGLRCILVDLSELKKLEDEHNKLSQIVEKLPDAVIILDQKGHIKYVNSALLRDTGNVSVNALLGCQVSEVVGDEDYQMLRDQVFPSLPAGFTWCGEIMVRKSDQTFYPAEVTCVGVQDATGTPQEIVAVLRDVTERKRIQMALLHNEENYRMLAENTPNVIWATDEPDQWAYVSPNVIKLCGYPAEDFMKGGINRWQELVHPDDTEKVGRAFAMLYQKPGTYEEEYRIQRKDGAWNWILTRATSMVDANGKVSIYGTTSDISERKEVESAFRESELRFRNLADNAPVLIWMAGMDRHTYYFNKTWRKFTGRTQTQEFGMGWKEGVHPDDLPMVLNTYKSSFAARRSFAIEYRLRNVDGIYHWILDNGTPRFTQEGSLAGYIGSAVDITDRKRSEDSYRESEQRYRNLFEKAPVMMQSFDSEGNLVNVSDYWLDAVGYRREEVVGRKIQEFLADELKSYWRELVIPTFFKTGELKSIPGRLAKKNGSFIDVEISASSERDAEGKIVRSVAVVTDVTERKRAEKALQSERMLHISGPVVVFKWRAAEGWPVDYVSPNVKSQYGYMEEQFYTGEIPYLSVIHPDDLSRVAAEVEAYALDGTAFFQQDYRIRAADGTYHWISDAKRIIRDSRNRVTAYHGYLLDITDRKRAEQTLFESEQRFRSLVNSVDDIVFTVDNNHQFTGLFSRWFTRHGITEGQTPLQLMEPVMAAYEAAAREMPEGESVTYENEIIHPSTSETRLMETTITPLLDENGEACGLVGISRDITDQSRVEMELRESEELYRAMFDVAFDDLLMSEDGVITKTNGRLAGLTGREQFETVGNSLMAFIAPEDRDLVRHNIQTNYQKPYEFRLLRKDGTVFPVEACGRTLLSRGRQIRITALRNISERREAEELLRAQSRLDATATLAGGIAHDFNNLMVAVLGNAELLAMHFTKDPEAIQMLTTIADTAHHAGELAKQMLAFAGGGNYQPCPLSINDAIHDALHSSMRELPSRVKLDLRLADDLQRVEADSGQMKQVIVSLIANAVEAIDGEGRIVIATSNQHLADEFLLDQTFAQPGPHVLLSIRDTGCGMSTDVQAHVFEPFFSTKFLGRGLGLAAVYGVVKNHGGGITVTSEVGVGTEFRIYLPVTQYEVVV